ncbi:nucleoside triphosphate pyrophosphohydrolase [Paenibacillus pasadenensis]|uniref:nucleoside triphosphate pyrophosphohydrolase n=1 Tax=Paenibacillus pasadenensis TaxID=217090 RepID=UPI000428FBF1|nr:nucleoside triphosphate pyrophosphohydrolase [Paenibacillus pasadenensis]
MPPYNKLVRDKIPAIIREQGLEPSTRLLGDEEYKQELRVKLAEETGEYLTALTDAEAGEELADILELLHALAAAHGLTPEQLETIRANKAAKRGGFRDRIYLIEVPDA